MNGKIDATGGPLKKNKEIGGPGQNLFLGQAWNKTNGTFSFEHAYVGYINDVNMWDELFTETRVRQLYLTCGKTVGTAVTWSNLKAAAESAGLLDSRSSKCPVTRSKYRVHEPPHFQPIDLGTWTSWTVCQRGVCSTVYSPYATH